MVRFGDAPVEGTLIVRERRRASLASELTLEIRAHRACEHRHIVARLGQQSCTDEGHDTCPIGTNHVAYHGDAHESADPSTNITATVRALRAA